MVLPIAVLVLAGALSSCGVVRPAEVDRVDEITVTGGTCRVEWWLAGVTDGATDEAGGVARAASVLEGAVHREVVRADVREALADEGFPDHERVIETYSSLRCSA